jgi:hypothetical protein
MMIASELFEVMRATVIASLPRNLTDEELKQQLFEAIYGASMEDFLSGKVTDASF